MEVKYESARSRANCKRSSRCYQAFKPFVRFNCYQRKPEKDGRH